MRPPSVARRYTLSTNVAISIRAPSGIVEPLSQRCTEPRLHQSTFGYVSSCRFFLAKRTLQSLAMKTHSVHHYPVGGSAPNSSGPVQHPRNPAIPLKPDIRHGSPPQHLPSTLHPSDTRKPEPPIPFGAQPAYIGYCRGSHRLPIQLSIEQAPRPLSTSSKPPSLH